MYNKLTLGEVGKERMAKLFEKGEISFETSFHNKDEELVY